MSSFSKTAEADVLSDVEDILSGDRRALAKAITLIESERNDHKKLAQQLLNQLLPHSGNALRIGISGSPGVGKSTLIEVFGLYLIKLKKRLAVLTIDPSSLISGGSILGDKTRMELLSREPSVYIRSSPSSGVIGGLARRTRETMLICEAAGYDLILIETVGVGQSEAAVAELADLFVLLVQPGGGDDLQGIKRGVMELADLVVVTKADGELTELAAKTQSDYRAALSLIQKRDSRIQQQVLSCSAHERKGMEDIWATITQYSQMSLKDGEFEEKRNRQKVAWMWQEIQEQLISELKNNEDIQQYAIKLESEVVMGSKTSSEAAAQILSKFQKLSDS